MKTSFFTKPAPLPVNRRAVLRDLYATGVVSVFRRPSLFRLWEPLREYRTEGEDFTG